MKRPGHLVFLLHMHQPAYTDPFTGRAELPWVRLHGARAYLDVARLLDEHEAVRLTVNFVPSLVAQLEAVVAGSEDAWLQLALKPTAELAPAEREFLVARLFSINWARAVEPRPRYRELLEKRGRELKPDELPARAARFSERDLRDLTVLFNLSWLGFAAREGDTEIAALEEKGHDYDWSDLKLVIDRQRAACARVLPLYRRLAERGQVELSASPYYHPIVPLLIDSEHARRALPALKLPTRFSYPEDAAAQIARGAEAHARAFGERPSGMWPPEGSVSPEAVAAYRAAGVRWLATDEGNLWRSLALVDQRAGRGDLYRAYRHNGVDLAFRDRELSDRIGFSYAHGDSAAGAADLLERARAAAAQSTAPPGEPALVPLFLDGENPWEAYPGSGEPFLRELFSALGRQLDLRAVSLGEHLRGAPSRVELPALHSGSWIDSDFHIWIGDPIKNRAWELLGIARGRFERARADGLAPERLQAAREHLWAAEGSDWFWWFGEPFHTAEDAIFDRLFRAHLAGVYAALGDPPPPALDQPVDTEGPSGAPVAVRPPFAFIRPRIASTGRPPSFYAWHGAGRYEVPRGAAMADSPYIETIYFGFDRSTLYLRLDPTAARAAELDGVKVEVDLTVEKRHLRLLISPSGWELSQVDESGWRDLGGGGMVAFHRTIEVGIPFARLGAEPRDRITLAFRLTRGAVALARCPADGTLSFSVPDDAFEVEHWSA
jgi:alpha-amylase/alpha-mannosidase (GH57 family)